MSTKPKSKEVTAESIKTAIDKSVDECLTSIHNAFGLTDNGTTKWLMACRIVNRLWTIVYKPALETSLRTMGGTVDEARE